jgi:hypothetical protein
MMSSLPFRQTIIPTCLVLGSAFLVLTLLFFVQPQSSAIRHASIVFPISLALVGVLLLVVGVLNMMLVKRELSGETADKP